MGVDNLGPIQGLPNTYWAQLGPNYNGAAFNPKTGELLIANWQTWGSASALIRVSVASPVPTYVGVINLSTPIVAQSGDFAIDATGTYAYGIATGARGASNTSYRIDLASGQLTPLMTGVGESIRGLVWAPYGGAARLQSGQLAFVGGFSTTSPGVRLMTIPSGTVSSPNFTTTDSAQGLDATECLPQLPVVTLACTPTALVDSPSNQAVCTITSDRSAIRWVVGGTDAARGERALQHGLYRPDHHRSCKHDGDLHVGRYAKHGRGGRIGQRDHVANHAKRDVPVHTGHTCQRYHHGE